VYETEEVMTDSRSVSHWIEVLCVYVCVTNVSNRQTPSRTTLFHL